MSTTFLPAGDPRSGSCAFCGAAMADDQRYCLSCGARREHARLPFRDALAPAAPVPRVGEPPPAGWYAPVVRERPAVSTATLLAALACVLVAFGVGILVGDGGGGQQPVVVGGLPSGAAAAPTATTTEEAAAEDGADEEGSAKDDEASDDTVPKDLKGEEKQEAEEVSKTPAKVPEAKPVTEVAKDLESKDPDKAREASQSLPDAVSTGGE